MKKWNMIIDVMKCEDCKKAINVKWADPDFNKKYFRPSTLFRPTKFEGYLNERPPKRYS